MPPSPPWVFYGLTFQSRLVHGGIETTFSIDYTHTSGLCGHVDAPTLDQLLRGIEHAVRWANRYQVQRHG